MNKRQKKKFLKKQKQKQLQDLQIQTVMDVLKYGLDMLLKIGYDGPSMNCEKFKKKIKEINSKIGDKNEY